MLGCLRFRLMPLTYAGTGEDLITTYSINNGTMTPVSSGTDIIALNASDQLSICHLSPGNNFTSIGTFVAFGSSLPTGVAFPIPFPGLHVNIPTSFVISQSQLVFGIPTSIPTSPGVCYGLNYPGGLAGTSVVVQCLVMTTSASNGVLASTDGLELQLL